MLDTSKWPSELNFCERYTCSLQKMTKNGPKRLILKCGSIFNASDFTSILLAWTYCLTYLTTIPNYSLFSCISGKISILLDPTREFSSIPFLESASTLGRWCYFRNHITPLCAGWWYCFAMVENFAQSFCFNVSACLFIDFLQLAASLQVNNPRVLLLHTKVT